MAAHLEGRRCRRTKGKIPQSELDTIRKWIEGGLLERQALHGDYGHARIRRAATPPCFREPHPSPLS